MEESNETINYWRGLDLNIAILPDVKSWATGAMARGLVSTLPKDWTIDTRFTTKSAGSKMLPLRNSEIEYDVIYTYFWRWGRKFFDDFKTWFPNTKLMAGVASYSGVDTKLWKLLTSCGLYHGMNTWSKEMYEHCKGDHPRFEYTRHGIDHKIFTPAPDGRRVDPFIVGWCGNVTHSKKNAKVLRKLKFNVLVHGRHLDQIVGENVSRYTNVLLPYEEVGKFYHQVSALAIPSISETGPLMALEAASSGLPIVSTRCGIVPELIDEEWLVDETRDHDVIAREINKRLHILQGDHTLAYKVGMENRARILESWTHEACANDWVRFFEST